MVPQSFLGFKRRPIYREEYKVTFRGWQLDEVTTLLGQSGPEWYKRTVAVAIGTDGELYRIERRREEKNGRPTLEDGRMIVTEINDLELRLFDMLDPRQYLTERPSGYWDLFPRKLSAAVDKLLH